MESTPPPLTPSMPVPRRGWWDRNWKWFVPVGCLSLIAIVVAFVAVILVIVFGALKSSDVYKYAVSRAKADSRVTSALGAPISEGLFMSGSTNVAGPSGNADIAIPISGPKGKATIYAVAIKSAGKWTYSKLFVQVDSGGDAIDLNEAHGIAP